MGVTWFFFIANIFIMQIVLLNFLIAEVSTTYERIKNLGPCLMFQKKQELNFFVQKILQISYDKKDPFKALVFVSPSTGEEEDEMDQVNCLRDELKHNMNKIRSEFNNGQQKMLDQFA